MPQDVRVKATNPHYDKLVGRKRTKGEVYEIPRDSAQRRADRGLINILKDESTPPKNSLSPVEEIKGATDVGAVPDEENLGREYPEDMEEVEEYEDEEEEANESFDPWDYVEHRGGSWYDVEDYDDNPVQGKDDAKQIAINLYKE